MKRSGSTRNESNQALRRWSTPDLHRRSNSRSLVCFGVDPEGGRHSPLVFLAERLKPGESFGIDRNGHGDRVTRVNQASALEESSIQRRDIRGIYIVVSEGINPR